MRRWGTLFLGLDLSEADALLDELPQGDGRTFLAETVGALWNIYGAGLNPLAVRQLPDQEPASAAHGRALVRLASRILGEGFGQVPELPDPPPAPGTLWYLHALLFREEADGTLVGPLLKWALPIGPDGVALTGPHFGLWRLDADTPERRVLVEGLAASLYPFLLAVALLHCKNVARVPQEPSAKLSRAHERRHGRPLVRYHVLDFQPMKEVLQREGDAERVGLQRALHICRAHFADSTQGKGLFGKYHGRYWVPAHVWGAVNEGAVFKDYAVREPSAAREEA